MNFLNFNKEKIEKWYEAIPLGNGNMGGLLFGGGSLVKLSVDCSTLWDLRQSDVLKNEDFTFSEFLKLVDKGEEYNDYLLTYFGRFFERKPYPTKIPSGSFEFVLPDGERTEFYFSMREATGGVKLSAGGVIESFFSPITHIGYIRCPKRVSFSFVAPKYQSDDGTKKENELSMLEYPAGSVEECDNTIVYTQPTTDGDYSVIAKYKRDDEYNYIAFWIRSTSCNFSVGEIEKMLDSRVFLDLYVRVKENWRDSDFNISDFGYRDEE